MFRIRFQTKSDSKSIRSHELTGNMCIVIQPNIFSVWKYFPSVLLSSLAWFAYNSILSCKMDEAICESTSEFLSHFFDNLKLFMKAIFKNKNSSTFFERIQNKLLLFTYPGQSGQTKWWNVDLFCTCLFG